MVKKQFLKSLRQYCQQLEDENRKLKDPSSVIGQFAANYEALVKTNQRLSVLVASLLRQREGKVKVSKDELEAFKGLLINVKWEMPEGVGKPEDASEYIFSYETLPDPRMQAPPPNPVESSPPHPDSPLPEDTQSSVLP